MTPTKMRPFGETIPLEAALTILDATGSPIARTERVRLEDANGRVLAKSVAASADVPPFSRAYMDGYAVKAADTRGATREQPRTLRQVGTLFTGQVSPIPVGQGECIEIATGAPMPEGADAVVMVEDTATEAGGRVAIGVELQPQQNVGKRGGDIQAGQAVLKAGETINSSRLGALAAVGASHLDVFDRPRVAILSTGNEIVTPGHPLEPGQIYDINRFTLASVVQEHGGIAVSYPPAPDTLDALVATLDECLENDIVVFSGGSSVGERDLIRDAIAARGELLFHGIAVKPGKPTGLGLVKGKPVFAMPGSPASCLSNAHILLVPLLRRIARLGPQLKRTVTVALSERVSSVRGRHQFLTVRIDNGKAVPAFKASGDITSMSRADGYIEIESGIAAVEAGALVDVTLF